MELDVHGEMGSQTISEMKTIRDGSRFALIVVVW